MNPDYEWLAKIMMEQGMRQIDFITAEIEASIRGICLSVLFLCAVSVWIW
jgi:hypothetical protein